MAVSECLPITITDRQRPGFLCRLCWTVLLSAGIGGVLPASRKQSARLEVAVAVLVLAGVSVGVWVERRRFPCLLVGWLWYLGMLAPVIGLVQVGDQAMADRYTYLPEIGLCLAVVWGVSQLSLSWPNRRWVCGVASVLAVTILAGIACRQTSYWRNSETLWTHTLNCTDRNATAQDNLGVAMMQRGNAPEAIKCFQEAIAIKPRAANARNNLGVLLAQNGQIDEAIGQFQAALWFRPNFVDARKNLGMAIAIRKQSQSERTSSPSMHAK